MKKTLFIAFITAIAFNAVAQKKVVDHERYYLARANFENRWPGKVFPLRSQLQGTPGYRAFTMNKKASMVFMGFEGCIPCKYQLPFLLRYAKARKDVAFFYMSFDSTATISAELARLRTSMQDHPNVRFITVSKTSLQSSGLAGFGYPVAYFLKNDHVIMNVDANGDLKMKEQEFKAQWDNKLFFVK